MGGKTPLLVAALTLIPACAASAVPQADSEAVTGTGVVHGAVVDASTGEPVHIASVRLEGTASAVLTNPEGTFAIHDVPVGIHTLTVRHVAYEPISRVITVRRSDETINLTIHLFARAHRLDEITVTADRVLSLTSGQEARYMLPQALIGELPIDDVAEIVGLLPGVVVSGSRPFFRGISFEHVVPLIDGVPAREPLRGEWIMPPPDAIHTAALISGAFDAEHGQALGGVMAVELPEGGCSHRGRVAYSSDRLGLASDTDTGTDLVRLSASGPISGRTISYAASWQGRLSDTYLRYTHSRPEQELFGFVSFGPRMHGEQTGSIRLAVTPPKASWKAAATLLHTEQRRKHYHDHYSRTGWVGYRADYGRYTTYLDDPSEADSVVFYDAPPRIPTRERVSTLLIGTCSARLASRVASRLHVRLARHTYGAKTERFDRRGYEEIRGWLWNEPTIFTNQEEKFYAVHGDYPDYEDGASWEAAAGASMRLRPGSGHDLSMGMGGTAGRHRHLRVPGGGFSLAGDPEKWMESYDCFAYIQDTWWSDKLSSMKIGLRWDGQQIDGYPGRGWGSTWSPRIGFHQPMTDVDALHVQAAVLYQFPPLMEHFPYRRIFAGEGIHLKAQRTRAFEVGMQHHFSRYVVAYVGSYAREYSDVVFSRRRPSEHEAILPTSRYEETLNVIDGHGIEVVIDHRLHRSINGQLSLSVGRMTLDGREVPWSRPVLINGWLFARPIRGLQLALSGIWDRGQSYSICLKQKGCLDEERYEGRLPSLFEVNLEGGWSPRVLRSRVRLKLEVRNLFNRRIPFFGFGLHSCGVGAGNFIAYYDETGRAGGYLVDVGNAIQLFDIDNPQTWTAGRNVRLGIEVAL